MDEILSTLDLNKNSGAGGDGGVTELISGNQQESQSSLLLLGGSQADSVPLIKINELQEALALYERLNMKSEFLYTLRLYTTLLVRVGDLMKLKELMMEYKFMTTLEEELLID